jgi:Leu/Phe-tRNA-protein transferase
MCISVPVALDDVIERCYVYKRSLREGTWLSNAKFS